MHDLYSSHSFEEQYTYNGCDLGAQWSPAKTVFRLWAPTAEKVTVNLYREINAQLGLLVGDGTQAPAEEAPTDAAAEEAPTEEASAEEAPAE